VARPGRRYIDPVRYYLGIDGGGTKTEMLLVDRDGAVVSHAVGAGCNPNRLSDEALARALVDGVALLAGEGRDLLPRIQVVFAGVAGASHPRNSARVRAALSAALPTAPLVRVASDTVPALWSGARGSPGIVLVAGTGATAYGEDGHGSWHRAGGWGYLIGDDGSGYALGREAVREVCRSADGSGEPTILWDKLAVAHGLHEPLDLVPFVYGRERPPFDELVPLVLEAWRDGDGGARRAVARVVDDQAGLIAAVHRTLGFDDAPLTLVLRGGLLVPGGVIRPLLLERLAGYPGGGRYLLARTEAPPVYGSALLALHQGQELAESTADALLANMRSSGLVRD
jgi:N-acetylglucosamine kinase-like BadF-type ATPase